MVRFPFYVIVLILILSGCENPSDGEFVFVPKDISEIYFLRSDGTGLRQLTNEKQFVHYADFIPNSNKILYVQSILGSGFQIIYTLDLISGQKDSICVAHIFQSTHNVDVPPYKRLQISLDGKYVYFAAWNSDDAIFVPRNIYKVNILTRQISNLTNYTSNDRINEFSLSNDESKIVYTVVSDFNRVSSVNILEEKSGIKNVMYQSDSGECFFPQILSDGKRVLFVESKNDREMINLIRIDSSNAVTTIGIELRRFIYYPKVSHTDNIVIMKADTATTFSMLNIDSQKLINLNIHGTVKPYFSKDESSILYFLTNWDMRILNLTDLTEKSLLLTVLNSGNTALPNSTQNNKDLVFLNTQTILERK